VVLECTDCRGQCFNETVLAVHYRGRNLAELLEMSVEAAARFLADQTNLAAGLAVLKDAGLSYLRLGQATHTLSGGEAQRLKLARQLWEGRKHAGRRLYLLDEPTSGLHAQDVDLLLRVLRKLTAAGHTLVVVEHHEALIAAADYVIELGPEGGENGGYLTAAN